MPRQHMLLARFDSHTQALNVTIVTGVLPGAFFAPSRAGSTVNPVDFFDSSDTVQPHFWELAGPFAGGIGFGGRHVRGGVQAVFDEHH